MPLKLSFACWDYDRMKALQDGRVRPEGVELEFLNLRVEETFFRQLRHEEFDVSELSLSSYVLTLNRPNPPFIALPVFPSRMFRHQSIYINKQSGIASPSDLRGKKVGVPEFQMTAPVWQRGILQSEYGVPFDTQTYFTGNVEPSTVQRPEKVKLDLPDDVKVVPIERGECLSEMLRDGKIDALLSATQPASLNSDPDKVGHLFPNFKQVEAEYFRKTGIFPIMHVIVLRRSLHDKHPWIAQSLMKAFDQALDLAYDALFERGALRYMLPWLQDHVTETQSLMGSTRYWENGLTEGSRKTLEAFLDYSYEQGLAKKRCNVEDLFAKEALERFVL